MDLGSLCVNEVALAPLEGAGRGAALWIEIVCLVHPMAAQSDWYLGSLLARSAVSGTLPARPCAWSNVLHWMFKSLSVVTGVNFLQLFFYEEE